MGWISNKYKSTLMQEVEKLKLEWKCLFIRLLSNAYLSAVQGAL